MISHIAKGRDWQGSYGGHFASPSPEASDPARGPSGTPYRKRNYAFGPGLWRAETMRRNAQTTMDSILERDFMRKKWD
jgi:hypothetical protein